ncbi:MAG: nucleotidyltransferase family protein, partial [Candidatus Bathyarchaeia archaeon]
MEEPAQSDVARLPPEVSALLAKYVENLIDRFGADLEGVALFGSVARGEAKFPDSDIDVFLVVKRLEGISMGGRIDLHADVETTLSRSEEWTAFREKHRWSPTFSPYILTPDEIKRHPPIMLDLATDAVILFDRGLLREEINVLQSRLKELGA